MLETNELNQATMITIPKNKSSNKNSIARMISPRYFTISATFAMTKLNRNARTILPSYHYDNSYLCKSLQQLNRNARTISPSYHYDNSYLCKSKTFKPRFHILKYFSNQDFTS